MRHAAATRAADTGILTTNGSRTMNASLKPMPPRNRLRPYLWSGAALLLLLPAIAMQLGAPGVMWTAADFLVMGVLLATLCGLYEIGARMSGNVLYRAGFGVAALTGFLTVWVNLAVGMLGDEGNPANWMFVGVLLLAVIGAMAAGGKPRGMVLAMLAAAGAQLLAVGVALWMGGFETRELTLTACFALPWLLAALLFRLSLTLRPGSV